MFEKVTITTEGAMPKTRLNMGIFSIQVPVLETCKSVEDVFKTEGAIPQIIFSTQG